jgi:hypothetical protein
VDVDHRAVVVFDVKFEVGERVDVVFFLAPMIPLVVIDGECQSVAHQSKLSSQCFFVSAIHFLLTPNWPPSRLFSYVSFATGLSLIKVLKSWSFCSSICSSKGVGFCCAPDGTLSKDFDVIVISYIVGE